MLPMIRLAVALLVAMANPWSSPAVAEDGAAEAPGFVIVQIDGLSEPAFAVLDQQLDQARFRPELAQFGRPPVQHVVDQKRRGVADVGGVVRRDPTRVHPHDLADVERHDVLISSQPDVTTHWAGVRHPG